jgi:hypothetical protein
MKSLFRGGAKLLAGQQVNKKQLFTLFVFSIIWTLIVLFIGRWLWNTILIELIPGIKPITSIWQILGLSVLISLLTGF